MTSSLQMALLWAAVVVGAAAFFLGFLPRRRERIRRLRTLARLLRAADPHARIDALEKARGLRPKDRALLARVLRRELAAAERGGPSAPAGQAITVWFIRQILALLGDSRTAVRTDAARVLRAVMGRDDAQLARDKDDSATLSPAVTAAVELAGGRILSGSQENRRQTRVLAFAELLEAGLRPLAVSIKALEGVGEDALEPLNAALRDRSPRVRRSLCEVLAAMGGERGIELLIPLLQDPSPELRARAAQSLGGLKAASASSHLTQLLGDPIASVRAAAASALAEIGEESACGRTIEALIEESRREDGAEIARAAMIDAIARVIDSGRPELAQALQVLPRPVAARLAASLESNGVVARWLTEPEWREGDALLAGLLGTVAELGCSRPFLEALDDAAERVRLRSAAALGHSQDRAALTSVAALLTDPEATVRAEAVSSVARVGNQLALDLLAQGAADPDPAVRLAAIGGLKQVLAERPSWRGEHLPADFDLEASLSESQRALLLATKDSDESVRMEAARGLGLLGSREGTEALVDLALGDANEVVREAAAEALGRCGFAQTRRLLAAALEAKEESQRARAMATLGALGGPEAGRHLVEGLHDPVLQVREAALEALSRLDLSSLKEKLAPELRNPDPHVRAGVATQLGRARATECTAALVQALGDPEEEVRVKVLRALAVLGHPVRKYESAVTARLTDPSPQVREAAAAALTALRAAWTEATEAAEIFGRGPLSPAGAAALVDMAADGDLNPLLWALDNLESAQTLVTFLDGPGREKLYALLSGLRQADEPDRMRALTALSQAVRQAGAPDGYLAELKAIDSEVRLMAVEMAGLLATPEAITGLLEALERDPLPEVRSRAASALADVARRAEQAPAAAEDLASASEPVRAALLRARQEDPNEVVRLVAARALGD